MRSPTLLRSSRRQISQRLKPRRRHGRRRLQVESLEPRTLLAADLGLGLAEGESHEALLAVQRVVSHEDRVAYDLQITDLAGKPVSAVTVGDDFVLHVTAEDLSDVPSGVFAAYLDVRYTSDAAELAGPISYSATYANGREGDLSVVGEIDEVGAFSGSNPLGGGRFEVFQIAFHATSAGRVVLEANAADDLPDSQTLLYDVDEPILEEDIVYGRATLTIVPAVVAVDDTYDVPLSSAAQTFEVLDNDVNFGGGTLSVVSVDGSGLLGSVAVGAEGHGVRYTPPVGFGGSEQFTYTISGPAGSSTAEVTVHVVPQAALDDLLEIRLAATDLDGNEITSIGAGQEFLVKAFVQDLREAGVDRGVYAAYFDLLYERAGIRPVQSPVGPVRPAIEFGSDYRNGVRGDASVPGIFDEIGAFQTGTTPLGTVESLLFAARFQARSSRGESDSFQIQEDTQTTLFVLENDLPNSGMTTLRADPADEAPLSDVLLYDPVEAVPYDRIRYGGATIEITSAGPGSITSVSAGSAGGSISIAGDGTSLLYAPAANFNGVESFTYSLDGDSQVEVSVTVLPVNDVPVAMSDSYRVRENRVLTVAADSGVAANDVEEDGDALSVALVDGTLHGSVQLEADGSFTYTPNQGYLGADRFTYQVTDGQATSAVATVEIDVVPRPVSIRLEALDANSQPVSDVAADQSLAIRTLVQDLRSPSDGKLGIGAAYLDISYDVDAINPVSAPDGPLGLDVQFGPAYQNGVTGELLPEGRLNDIGAFQTDLQPLGGDEIELFRMAFDLKGPRTIDDSYTVAVGTSVNHLAVLNNETELRWNVTLDAQHAANSPNADVAYLDPAQVVPETDIHYGDVVLAVRNGQLAIQSVGDSVSGAAISIASNGVIDYQPVEGFTGQDSFTYTVVDGRGRSATATVTLEVALSWQNSVQPTDVNGDGNDSPLDALVIINELNTVGPHELDGDVVNVFLDVNGDGVVSPIDALLVINRLLETAFAGEGEFVDAGMASEGLLRDPAAETPLDAAAVAASPVHLILPEDVDAATASPDFVPELPTSSTTQANSRAPRNAAAVQDDRGRLGARLRDPGLRSVAVANNRAVPATDVSNVEDNAFSDLLDAVADDIAPLWAAFFSSCG